MRKHLILLIMLGISWVPGSGQTASFKKIEDFKFAWTPGQPMEFIIERQADWTEGEPETAPARIRIVSTGEPTMTLPLQWGVTQYADELANMATFPKNLANSHYLLFVNVAKDQPPMLFAVGSAYGDTNGPVYAFTLNLGLPHPILANERFGFSRFEDVDDDGVLEIVGPKCVPSDGPDEPGTYDPFLVWKIGESDVKLDPGLTRKYNEQHYVWAGVECRDDVKAVKDKSGKYQLVKLSDWYAAQEKKSK